MVIPNCTPFPTNFIVANKFSKSFKKLRKKKVSFSQQWFRLLKQVIYSLVKNISTIKDKIILNRRPDVDSCLTFKDKNKFYFYFILEKFNSFVLFSDIIQQITERKPILTVPTYVFLPTKIPYF